MNKIILIYVIVIGVIVVSFSAWPVKAMTMEEIQLQLQQISQNLQNLLINIQLLENPYRYSLDLPLQTTTTTWVVFPAGCPFVSTLSRSYKDPDPYHYEIKELQKLLQKYPDLYPNGQVTGYFGVLTEGAIKRLQAKYGIRVTGQVGPQTRAKLCELWEANKGE